MTGVKVTNNLQTVAMQKTAKNCKYRDMFSGCFATAVNTASHILVTWRYIAVAVTAMIAL